MVPLLSSLALCCLLIPAWAEDTLFADKANVVLVGGPEVQTIGRTSGALGMLAKGLRSLDRRKVSFTSVAANEGTVAAMDAAFTTKGIDPNDHSGSVVFVGTVDAWDQKAGAARTEPETYRTALQGLLAKVQFEGKPCLVVSPLLAGEHKQNPSDASLDALAAITKEVAEASGAMYLDARTSLRRYIEANNPRDREKGILTRTGFDLNKTGHEILSQLMADKLGYIMILTDEIIPMGGKGDGWYPTEQDGVLIVVDYATSTDYSRKVGGKAEENGWLWRLFQVFKDRKISPLIFVTPEPFSPIGSLASGEGFAKRIKQAGAKYVILYTGMQSIIQPSEGTEAVGAFKGWKRFPSYERTRMRNDFNTFLQSSRRVGIRAAIMTIPPWPASVLPSGADKKIIEFNNMLRDLASKHRVPLLDFDKKAKENGKGGFYVGKDIKKGATPTPRYHELLFNMLHQFLNIETMEKIEVEQVSNKGVTKGEPQEPTAEENTAEVMRQSVTLLADIDQSKMRVGKQRLLDAGPEAYPFLLEGLEGENKILALRCRDFLREASGQNFGYSIAGSPEDRSAAISKWKAWAAGAK